MKTIWLISRVRALQPLRAAADAFVGLFFRKLRLSGFRWRNRIALAMRASNERCRYAWHVALRLLKGDRSGGGLPSDVPERWVDWEGDFEKRAYATAYRAEDILNWRVERLAATMPT